MQKTAAVIITALLVLASLAAPTFAKPANIPGARVELYKTVDDVELYMYFFEPEEHEASHKRPAIVLFFGGGWVGGTPKHLTAQSRYLASRGMVAAVVDYRVKKRNNTTPLECVKDGRSAVRYLRKNAARLGIDPDRIAAGGGSAGGHIAAATACCDHIDEAGEDTGTSAVPNAVVMFNPGLIVGEYEPPTDISDEQKKVMDNRFGASESRNISPYHHIRKDLPPMIIFTGEADTVTPVLAAKMFTKKMKEADNRCELHTYAGQGHGFFNKGREGSKYFRLTMHETDRFLKSLGWLEGEPTIGNDE